MSKPSRIKGTKSRGRLKGRKNPAGKLRDQLEEHKGAA